MAEKTEPTRQPQQSQQPAQNVEDAKRISAQRQQPVAVAPSAGAPPLAPAVTPIFEEVQKLERAQDRTAGGERHTLGAWARAKGVPPEKIRDAMKSGTLTGSMSGDGPEMTEEEFDEAVGFEYRNTFGPVAGLSVHIPADQARGGAPLTGEELAAAEDAAAAAARRRSQV